MIELWGLRGGLPFWYVIACLILIFCGIYYFAEALANLIYWWNDRTHPAWFQIGRAIRMILALIVIATTLELLFM